MWASGPGAGPDGEAAGALRGGGQAARTGKRGTLEDLVPRWERKARGREWRVGRTSTLAGRVGVGASRGGDRMWAPPPSSPRVWGLAVTPRARPLWKERRAADPRSPNNVAGCLLWGVIHFLKAIKAKAML